MSFESLKEYYQLRPKKYEMQVMEAANYGVLDDVVRRGAERLKDASQPGSGQDRNQVLREVVKDVNNHCKEQDRQYYAERRNRRS